MARQPTVLVTNVTGYAGPPSVDALTKAGFRVLVHDRCFDVATSWSEFSAAHPGAELLLAEDVESLASAAWETGEVITAIVSNDHYPAVQNPTGSASVEDLRATLERLVVDPFRLIRAAIPYFKAQQGGNIVMITSCRTLAPIPGGAIPDMARAAANALVRSLAIELAPHEVAVNAIAPNYLYSEAYYPRSIFVDSPEGRDYVSTTVPAGRLGRPDEIGELVGFLASTQARFLTGAVIDFNGGWPFSAVRPQQDGPVAQ